MASLGVSTGASKYIPSVQADMIGSAGRAITEARAALDELANSLYVPNINVVPEEAKDNAFNFNRIDFDEPDYNSGDIEDYSVSANKLTHPQFKSVTEEKYKTPDEPSIAIPEAPDIIDVAEPGSPPKIETITYPSKPTTTTISEPSLFNITLPPTPNINIPKFEGIKPTFAGVTLPDADDFNWADSVYDSELLQATVAQISAFLAGGVGIPDVVWNAIWQRDIEREDMAGQKAIEAVNDQWDARGFSLPQGVQNAQVKEIIQTVLEKSISRSRDIAIEQAKHEIENLRFAVQQGIAMEGLRGGFYNQTQERILNAYKFSAEFSITVANAHIELFNAKVKLYNVEAEVYKALIEAELAEVESYKYQVEGQKVISEINKTQVALYSARLEAVTQKIEIYKTEVASANLELEGQRLLFENYKTEVEAYAERIKAVATEYSLYVSQMEAAKIHGDIYNSSVEAYAKKIQAYAIKQDIHNKEIEAKNNINTTILQERELEIKQFTTKLSAQIEKLKIDRSVFEDKVKVLALKLDQEKSLSNVNIDEFKMRLSEAEQTNRINMGTLTEEIKAFFSASEIIQENLKQIAEVNSAYAGSALSALNVGARISDSATNSFEAA